MPALRETQAAVMAALLAREAEVPRAVRPAARFAVYRNNLVESLTGALADVYPVVRQLVGEAFFRGLARAFLRAHPSRAGHLQPFGAELPSFVAAFPPAAGLPYLGDVAALEWACHEAWHEAEWPALDPARLGALPSADLPALRLHLQPSARLVASRYPVLRIWQANQPEARDAAVSLDEGGVRLLVVQHDLEVEFQHLDAGEHAWLRQLATGATVLRAAAAACAADPAFDLGATLARHCARRLFTGLAVQEEA